MQPTCDSYIFMGIGEEEKASGGRGGLGGGSDVILVL